MPRYLEDKGYFLEVPDEFGDDQLPNLAGRFKSYISDYAQEEGPKAFDQSLDILAEVSYVMSQLPEYSKTRLKDYVTKLPGRMKEAMGGKPEGDITIDDAGTVFVDGEPYQTQDEEVFNLVAELAGGSALRASPGVGTAGIFPGMRGAKAAGDTKNIFNITTADDRYSKLLEKFNGNKTVAEQEMWNQTGLHRGPEGLWRFEIDDTKANFISSLENKILGRSKKVGEVFDHPELYRYYPELKDAKVKFKEMDEGYNGRFNPRDNTFEINPNSSDPRSTMLHELQHYIQYKENFAFGGSSKDIKNYFTGVLLDEDASLTRAIIERERELNNLGKAKDDDALYSALVNARNKIEEQTNKIHNSKESEYDLYRNLSGEIEARLVQLRDKISRAVDSNRNTKISPMVDRQFMKMGEGLDKTPEIAVKYKNIDSGLNKIKADELIDSPTPEWRQRSTGQEGLPVKEFTLGKNVKTEEYDELIDEIKDFAVMEGNLNPVNRGNVEPSLRLLYDTETGDTYVWPFDEALHDDVKGILGVSEKLSGTGDPTRFSHGYIDNGKVVFQHGAPTMWDTMELPAKQFFKVAERERKRLKNETR